MYEAKLEVSGEGRVQKKKEKKERKKERKEKKRKEKPPYGDYENFLEPHIMFHFIMIHITTFKRVTVDLSMNGKERIEELGLKRLVVRRKPSKSFPNRRIWR